MSFRVGLLPRFLPKSSPRRCFHIAAPRPPNSQTQPRGIALLQSQLHYSSGRFLPRFTLGLGLTAFALHSWSSPTLFCESQPPLSVFAGNPGPRPEVGGGGPPPESQLSAFQLGFGSVAGICTGVFIKKGLKAIAFLLGGAFVLLQYLSSKSIIRVDWGRLSSSYNSALGTKTPTGEIRTPTVGGVWAWMVDFLTANFQQRATFLAGLVLGLRLG